MEKNTYTIYHDFEIKAPIDQVFQHITQPEHLIHWWPLKCSGKPELNQEYNFYFAAEYNWYGKVIKISHPDTFYIKMTKSDKDWNTTSFGFDLTETNGAVQVAFSHGGWQGSNKEFRNTSFCWALLLNGLKDYTEKGSIVPFEERA